MKMLTIHTKTLGNLEISFQHFTGDADVELRRILTEHHIANKTSDECDIREEVKKDLTVLGRLSSIERLHILVDVGDRKTLAFIRPANSWSVETECKLHPDTIFTGVAYVNPVDQYKKEEGRFLALNRAIDEMEVNDAIRREILSGYFNR